MAKVNVTEAARLAGIGRAHLYRKYLSPKDKDGKLLTPLLSVERDHQGNTTIDTSELLRVFGKLCETPGNIVSGDFSIREETIKRDAILTTLATEATLLHEQLTMAKEQIRSLQSDKEYLKTKLDETMEHLSTALQQIEHKPDVVPVVDQERPSWLVRLLTKKVW
jgi:hypothetical protein